MEVEKTAFVEWDKLFEHCSGVNHPWAAFYNCFEVFEVCAHRSMRYEGSIWLKMWLKALMVCCWKHWTKRLQIQGGRC